VVASTACCLTAAATAASRAHLAKDRPLLQQQCFHQQQQPVPSKASHPCRGYQAQLHNQQALEAALQQWGWLSSLGCLAAAVKAYKQEDQNLQLLLQLLHQRHRQATQVCLMHTWRQLLLLQQPAAAQCSQQQRQGLLL
jgi:hypothetical protein